MKSTDAASDSSPSSIPNTAMNLLYNLLYATDEDLEFFMSPPNNTHPNEFKDGKTKLTLGAPLGFGGFATVYLDYFEGDNYVIKCARDSSYLYKLKNEYDLLSKQLKMSQIFQRLVDSSAML